MPRPKIIAVDFDGTIATDKYPLVGEPIYATIVRIQQEQRNGAKIILWTNRTDKALDRAVEFCHDYGILLDAVNDNIQSVIDTFGCNPRKIFANEYWDDRMVALPHLKHPERR